MAYRMTANGELAYRSHSECADVIRCNGKPILTDTVFFWVKNMKSNMIFKSNKVPDGI